MAVVWQAVEPNIPMYAPSTIGVPHRTLTRTRVLPTVLGAEVRYAVHNEYAQTAVKFVARRRRLTSLNAQIALDVLPAQRAPVVETMAQELRWSTSRRRRRGRPRRSHGEHGEHGRPAPNEGEAGVE
jgi:glycerol-3-phosphate dehydrogenase